MHERPVSNRLRTSTFASILAKRYHVKRKPKLLLAFRDFQTELPAVPTKQLLLDLKSRAEPEGIAIAGNESIVRRVPQSSIGTGLRTLVEQFMAGHAMPEVFRQTIHPVHRKLAVQHAVGRIVHDVAHVLQLIKWTYPY